MTPAVAYTRLSKPNKTGRPGIGLDAQQAALEAFAKAEGFDLVQTFAEVETGEGSFHKPLRCSPRTSRNKRTTGEEGILQEKTERSS